jgi:hypothetical protein
MKMLAALALALFLAGCAKDNEDRAFFNEGWVKPDQAANRRMYGNREKAALEQPPQPDTR